MNVAFYYTNKRTAGKDVRNVLEGNPGIGGTYYAMLLLAKLLTGKEDAIKVYLFAEYTNLLPDGLNIVHVPTIETLPKAIADNDIDILVVNKIGADTLNKKFFNQIRAANVDIIVWCHCFVNNKGLNILAEEPLVKKIIAVSKTQMLTWYDHDIYKKATYIYNICDFKNPSKVHSVKKNNDVVYVGAINGIKGVHYLTQAWNYVLKKYPKSHLYIIGSGRLYNSNTVMGSFGIAEKFYEQKLLRPILKDGKIIPSVHFLGIMGMEKWNVLNRCKVGVVNAGSWETFGYTMVEMQLAGLLVASLNSPGLLDTMYPNNGILYDNPKKLANSIIKLLEVENHDYEPGISYILNNFSRDIILKKWINLLQNNQEKIDFKVVENFKYLRAVKVNHYIRTHLKFMPSIIFYRDWYLFIKKSLNSLSQPQKIYSKLLKKIAIFLELLKNFK